jgi:hypothetical protein
VYILETRLAVFVRHGVSVTGYEAVFGLSSLDTGGGEWSAELEAINCRHCAALWPTEKTGDAFHTKPLKQCSSER